MSDLIVKGAGEIKDGLYNIKDGKLFKYKANGGTVRTYQIVSADRPTGHWIENAQEYYEMINEKGGGVDENTPYFIDDIACSECLAKFSVIDNETERFDFCPNCGCAMKGGEEE